MTGVGGRPELVIEGSNSLSAGWKEYHFLYKPGDVSKRPPVLSMYSSIIYLNYIQLLMFDFTLYYESTKSLLS